MNTTIRKLNSEHHCPEGYKLFAAWETELRRDVRVIDTMKVAREAYIAHLQNCGECCVNRYEIP